MGNTVCTRPTILAVSEDSGTTFTDIAAVLSHSSSDTEYGSATSEVLYFADGSVITDSCDAASSSDATHGTHDIPSAFTAASYKKMEDYLHAQTDLDWRVTFNDTDASHTVATVMTFSGKVAKLSLASNPTEKRVTADISIQKTSRNTTVPRSA